MAPSEFLALADEALAAIEDAVARVADSSDIDIEADRSGNVLEIAFADRSKIIVNLQEPMSEIWLAARGGAFHFRWNGVAWVDTREGRELFDTLSKFASQHAGTALLLKA
ncbi:MAG TPA: iron donor protein CyaY [Burkholderiaceae bacterium]|nr:iron donor protein CyaY [Burkholderiaceae bacterium]